MSQHGCPERLSNRSKGFQDESSSQPTMEVLVETLTGTAFEMTVLPTDTIFAIKSKIFRVEGIPVSQQHLLYNLKELEDASSLREHAIGDGARLRLVLGMRGGPISTRRLPPPPSTEPWRDIERLLETNRDEVEWAGAGCKVTVLVFRDGERVNMLRVKENHDGTYSPLDHNYSASTSSVSQLAEREGECAGRVEAGPAGGAGGAGGGGSLHDNAVTMGKMLELRQRMESLSLQRANAPPGDKAEIQKTRSEETLSVPSLLDEVPTEPFKHRTYTPYSEAEDTFAPLYDGNYTRYDYDCSFTDRYTLLPPIAPAPAPAPPQDAPDPERVKLSDALAGSILVKGRREPREDGAAILEECLDTDQCHLTQDSPQLAAKNLAPIPAAEYGPVVGGAGGAGWRGLALHAPHAPHAPHALHAPHSHSASSLHVHRARHHQQPPLSDALFSSSTSDLEKLKRNGRMLPALSRHRNREHLHLSDERLELAPPAADAAARLAPERPERTERLDPRTERPEASKPQAGAGAAGAAAASTARLRCLVCRRRLGAATRQACRCGGWFCAPHRYAEVHGCRYDYKAAAQQALAKDNPRVAAAKLPDI